MKDDIPDFETLLTPIKPDPIETPCFLMRCGRCGLPAAIVPDTDDPTNANANEQIHRHDLRFTGDIIQNAFDQIAVGKIKRVTVLFVSRSGHVEEPDTLTSLYVDPDTADTRGRFNFRGERFAMEWYRSKGLTLSADCITERTTPCDAHRDGEPVRLPSTHRSRRPTPTHPKTTERAHTHAQPVADPRTQHRTGGRSAIIVRSPHPHRTPS